MADARSETLQEVLDAIHSHKESIKALKLSDDPERYDRITELNKTLDSYAHLKFEVIKDAVFHDYDTKTRVLSLAPSGWGVGSIKISAELYMKEVLEFKRAFNGKLILFIELNDLYRPVVTNITDDSGKVRFRASIPSLGEGSKLPLLSEKVIPMAKLLALTPEGERILILDNHGNINAVSTVTGKTLWEASVHTIPSDALFDREGSRAVVSTISGGLHVFSLRDGSLISRRRFPGSIRTTSLSPSGTLAFVGLMSGEAAILDLDEGKVVFKTKHNGPVSAVNFSHDNRYAFSGGADSRVKIIYLPAMEMVWELHLKGVPESIRISPTGENISTLSSFVYLGVWNMDYWTKSVAWKFQSFVTSYEYSHDGSFVACAFANKFIGLFDIASGKTIAKIPLKFIPGNITFLPGTKLIACADRTGKVHLVDYEKRDITTSLNFEIPVIEIVTNNSGEYLSILRSDGTCFNLFVRRTSGTIPLFNVGTTLVVTGEPGK